MTCLKDIFHFRVRTSQLRKCDYSNLETNPKLTEAFEENISPDYLMPILSQSEGQTIVKEKALIVFDEGQLCEKALTSLKYFYETAPDYHIILRSNQPTTPKPRPRRSIWTPTSLLMRLSTPPETSVLRAIKRSSLFMRHFVSEFILQL